MHPALPQAVATAVATAGDESCHTVSSELQKAAATADAGDGTLAKEMLFVAQVLGMLLAPSNAIEPYRPMAVFGDKRSALPEDCDDAHLALLAELLPTVMAPDVAARIADVLWLRRRDVDHAIRAVNHYLDVALQREDFTHWTDCAERLERALRLAAQVRRGKREPYDRVIAHIQAVLERANGEDPLFLSHRLMDLLYQFDEGDTARYLQLSETIANEAQQTKNFHKAEAYWQLHEMWARKTRDESLIQKARIALAESYALYGESIIASGGSALLATHWLEKAVEAYKAVAGAKDRRQELYALLRSRQKASLAEFKSVGGEIDISEVVRQSLDSVRGKSLEDALFTLAYRVIGPPDYDKLRTQAQDHFRQFPLSNLFGGIQLDTQGRIVSRRAAGLAGDPDERAIAEWQEVLRIASMQHNLAVQGVIEPIRQELCADHYVLERDIARYCLNNPFIADGQEYLYAKGLYAGITGDFISAIHILVPLIENSLRHVLAQRGVETSSLNAFGVQEEMHLPSILDHEETKRVFGDAQVSDLRAILVERSYANMRNRVAHGLMSAGEFFQASAIYFWWICLRYVLRATFQSHRDDGAESAPAT
jgi:hypothetical protein